MAALGLEDDGYDAKELTALRLAQLVATAPAVASATGGGSSSWRPGSPEGGTMGSPSSPTSGTCSPTVLAPSTDELTAAMHMYGRRVYEWTDGSGGDDGDGAAGGPQVRRLTIRPRDLRAAGSAGSGCGAWDPADAPSFGLLLADGVLRVWNVLSHWYREYELLDSRTGVRPPAQGLKFNVPRCPYMHDKPTHWTYVPRCPGVICWTMAHSDRMFLSCLPPEASARYFGYASGSLVFQTPRLPGIATCLAAAAPNPKSSVVVVGTSSGNLSAWLLQRTVPVARTVSSDMDIKEPPLMSSLWQVNSAHGGSVISLAATPSVGSEPDAILSAGLDHTVRLWAAATGQLIASLAVREPITSMCLTRVCGKRLLAIIGTTSSRFSFWDVSHECQVQQYTIRATSPLTITSLATQVVDGQHMLSVTCAPAALLLMINIAASVSADDDTLEITLEDKGLVNFQTSSASSEDAGMACCQFHQAKAIYGDAVVLTQSLIVCSKACDIGLWMASNLPTNGVESVDLRPSAAEQQLEAESDVPETIDEAAAVDEDPTPSPPPTPAASPPPSMPVQQLEHKLVEEEQEDVDDAELEPEPVPLPVPRPIPAPMMSPIQVPTPTSRPKPRAPPAEPIITEAERAARQVLDVEVPAGFRNPNRVAGVIHRGEENMPVMSPLAVPQSAGNRRLHQAIAAKAAESFDRNAAASNIRTQLLASGAAEPPLPTNVPLEEEIFHDLLSVGTPEPAARKRVAKQVSREYLDKRSQPPAFDVLRSSVPAPTFSAPLPEINVAALAAVITDASGTVGESDMWTALWVERTMQQ